MDSFNLMGPNEECRIPAFRFDPTSHEEFSSPYNFRPDNIDNV